MDWPQLTNPPIKEAILDFKFPADQKVTVESIRLFCESLKDRFPIISQMFRFNVDIEANLSSQPKQQLAASQMRALNGYRLSSQDKSFIFQFSVDGIRLSKVAPYISWSNLYDEVLPILNKLASSELAIRFRRIGIRYINKFSVHFAGPINEYFNILPVFPKKIPQLIGGFTIRLVIPKREHQLVSNINLNVVPTKIQSNASDVEFNINVYRDDNYQLSDTDRIISDLTKIRDFKNEIFFNGLSEKTINTFK